MHPIRFALLSLAAACAACALATGTAQAQSVPATVSFSGRLADQGTPLSAALPMSFRLFRTAEGGSAVWEEAHPSVTVDEGRFYAELGASSALEAVFDGGALFLEVSVDGKVFAPRLPLLTVPYAFRAASAAVADRALVADRLGSHGPDDFVTGVRAKAPLTVTEGPAPMVGLDACAEGELLQFVDGDWACTPQQTLQGPRGETGPVGPAGPAGLQGERGPQGEIGPSGPAGATGPQGEQGAAGPTGPEGPRGSQGLQGERGPQGELGPVGATGAAGPQGEPGPVGATGAIGPQGEQGSVGPAGPEGPRGLQGLQGEQGPVGPAGSANISGTVNTLVKFTGPTTGGSSSLVDDGTSVQSSARVSVTGGAGTVYSTAPIEVRTTQTPRIAFHRPGVVASQLGMDEAGVIRTYNNPGTGYEQLAASNVYANGFLSISGPADAAGNLRFTAANPYLVASSYLVVPGGAFFNSGTVYFQSPLEARGGIHNDAAAYLQISGGTSGVTYFSGSSGFGTSSPAEQIHATGNMRADGSVYWGNGLTRTETKNDLNALGSRSGFFETSAPVNAYPNASSWQHVIDVRHSNNSNNYAMQIAGSFFDQDLWFRKTNNSAAAPWNQLIGAGQRQCTPPFNSAGATVVATVGGITRSNTLCATTWLSAATFEVAVAQCFALGGRLSTYGDLYQLALANGASSVLFVGDWIGNRVGDDSPLIINSTNIANFDGTGNRSDSRPYRCVNSSPAME